MGKKMFRSFCALVALFALFPLAGCANSEPGGAADTAAKYPDPPESERLEALPLYIAWDGAGGESWTYAMSQEGIIEEGSQPAATPAPEDSDLIVVEEYNPPGGRTVWFYGAEPGDVTLTFTTIDSKDKVMAEQTFTIRVFDDLKIALLDEEYKNMR